MAFRLCFFLFNLMFFIGGCFVIGMGAHMAVKFEKYFGSFTNCEESTPSSTRQLESDVEACKAYPEIEAIPTLSLLLVFLLASFLLLVAVLRGLKVNV